MQDIDIPGVEALQQNARFFLNGKTEMVEISYVGSKDTLVKKVSPELMARFHNEWNAFCDGRPLEKRSGTDLTTVVESTVAEKYINQNVHTLEELAALSDIQCQSLGHGTLTARTKAREFLETKKLKEMQDQQKKISVGSSTARPAPEVEAQFASKEDLAAVRDDIASLSKNMAALIEAISSKPKRGRPAKEKAEE